MLILPVVFSSIGNSNKSGGKEWYGSARRCTFSSALPETCQKHFADYKVRWNLSQLLVAGAGVRDLLGMMGSCWVWVLNRGFFLGYLYPDVLQRHTLDTLELISGTAESRTTATAHHERPSCSWCSRNVSSECDVEFMQIFSLFIRFFCTIFLLFCCFLAEYRGLQVVQDVYWK